MHDLAFNVTGKHTFLITLFWIKVFFLLGRISLPEESDSIDVGDETELYHVESKVSPSLNVSNFNLIFNVARKIS
jgi:hypothetical protein